MTVALLGFGELPVLADAPGEEPTLPPSPAPSLTPSTSPSPSYPAPTSPTPSLTPSVAPNPGRTASPSPSVQTPEKVHELPGDVVGVIGNRRVLQANQGASVSAIDDAFRPTPLTVTVGTTVTWTNQGQNLHTVTANDRAFDSSTLEAGQTFSVTFDEVGQVPYYCQIHGEPGSGMTGVVIVQEASNEEGEEGPPASGSGGLAATGFDPIPLALGAIGLAIMGLVALRLGRRSIGEGR